MRWTQPVPAPRLDTTEGWGACTPCALPPRLFAFRSRQGISDENKGDFFLFAQVATPYRLSPGALQSLLFQELFSAHPQGSVPGRNQNNGLIFSQVSVSSGECINIVHVNIGRLMLQLRRRLIYARKSLEILLVQQGRLAPEAYLEVHGSF